MLRSAVAVIALCLLLVISTAVASHADDAQRDQSSSLNLKQLSLEQLGNVEVTSFSKDPRQVMKTPAAIFVITPEDIRRSGATTIPEALRRAWKFRELMGTIGPSRFAG